MTHRALRFAGRMNRNWLISKTNPEFLSFLSASASISPIIAQILVNRGIKTPEAVEAFLNPSIAALSDPFGLSGMRSAVDRIREAVKRRERVLVHGDYDADGLTATAILVHLLKRIGLDVQYFVPVRATHGYGFAPHAVQSAREAGAGLIITVDCGITSHEAALAARREGIDVIITDHHEPMRGTDREEVLVPDACAVIDPKLPGHAPELMSLSGAGIAFKMAHALALAGLSGLSVEDALGFLDLAALGTVADVVPLTGENRIIVREGLRLFKEAPRTGLKALWSVCGLNGREARAGLFSFTLVPRINAAGRMAGSADVVRLLLTDDADEASELSGWLDRLNSERQATEEAVFRDAISRIDSLGIDGAIVLAGEGWHQGVLGIVASRIAEEFYRPTFIFSIEGGVARGSARSVPAFDICHGLAQCSHLLLSFGGHRQAAGVRMNADAVKAFQREINELVKRSVDGRDLTPTLEIDALVSLSDVTHGLVKEMSRLEPFGYGNAEPLLGSRGLEVVGPRAVGSRHLKMRVKKFSQSIDTIGFDLWSSFEDLDQPATVDAVFTPGINEWNGNRYLQLVVKALRPGR